MILYFICLLLILKKSGDWYSEDKVKKKVLKKYIFY